MLYRRKILKTVGACWLLLGYKRGINQYNYYKNQTETYLYSYAFAYGLYGVIGYINPLLIPILLSKEVYRIEVDLRNLEDEKKTKFYNSVYYF
jgi:hypothetical protein